MVDPNAPTLPAVSLDGPLAGGAHQPAVLLAFLAHAVEEFLAHGGVVAIAHGGHEPSAVPAQMLDGPFLRDVPLVRHEDGEDQDEESDDNRNR